MNNIGGSHRFLKMFLTNVYMFVIASQQNVTCNVHVSCNFLLNNV